MKTGVKIPTFRTGIIQRSMPLPLMDFKEPDSLPEVLQRCRHATWRMMDLMGAPKLKATETRCV